MRMMLIRKDNDNGYADMNVRIKTIKTNMKVISNIHRSVSIYHRFLDFCSHNRLLSCICSLS